MPIVRTKIAVLLAGTILSSPAFANTVAVTNLNDSGAGSLRACAEGTGNNCVFEVGGTISVKTPIQINGNGVRISGQTAPGGITLVDGGIGRIPDSALIKTTGRNVVIEDMTFLPGGTDPDSETNRGVAVRGGDAVLKRIKVEKSKEDAVDFWSQTEEPSSLKLIDSHIVGNAKGLVTGANSEKALKLMTVEVIGNHFEKNDDRNPFINTGRAIVANNTIENFGRGAGIMFRGGTVADVTGNRVIGGNPQDAVQIYTHGSAACSGNDGYCLEGNPKLYLAGNSFSEGDVTAWNEGYHAVPDGTFSSTPLTGGAVVTDGEEPPPVAAEPARVKKRRAEIDHRDFECRVMRARYDAAETRQGELTEDQAEAREGSEGRCAGLPAIRNNFEKRFGEKCSQPTSSEKTTFCGAAGIGSNDCGKMDFTVRCDLLEKIDLSQSE